LEAVHETIKHEITVMTSRNVVLKVMHSLIDHLINSNFSNDECDNSDDKILGFYKWKLHASLLFPHAAMPLCSIKYC